MLKGLIGAKKVSSEKRKARKRREKEEQMKNFLEIQKEVRH